MSRRPLVAAAVWLSAGAAAGAQAPAGATGSAAATRESSPPRQVVVGAALDPESFGYARALPAGEGLTTLRLDAAALAHSRIDDLRIVDASGRQIPYLVEPLGEPTELPLPALEPIAPRTDVTAIGRGRGQASSWYRLRLPEAGLPGARLRIGTPSRVFQRELIVVTIDSPRDAPAHSMADQAVTVSWAHSEPDSATPPLEIPLGRRLASDSLFVLVNDGDNERLALGEPTLLLPTYRLRFFRPRGDSLTLLYGRAELDQPRYDLSLIAPRILEQTATDIAPGPERRRDFADRGLSRIAFWIVLGGAVTVLLVLVARLLRAPPASRDSEPTR